MNWAIWDAVSGNAIVDFKTESEALAYVRALIEQGWKSDELVLIFDDPALADADLPPGVSGDELTRRVEGTGQGSRRRTA